MVLYGCSVTSPAISDSMKFHVYDCKTSKIVQNLSDSTKVLLSITPYHDKTVLNLFENGILSFKILKHAFENGNKWIEFDAIQPEIIRTYSDICSHELNDEIGNEKAVFIEGASSKVEADGSTLYRLEFFFGQQSGTLIAELKQTKQGHFAIKYTGYIL